MLGLVAAVLSFVALAALITATRHRQPSWADLSIQYSSIISVQTSYFSKQFARVGRQHKRPLQSFFNLAPAVAAALAVAALCMLMREAGSAVWSLIQALGRIFPSKVDQLQRSSLQDAADTAYLTLALPGWTIPLSHAGYLWLAAAVSLSIHESGHALAASCEGVSIQHIAVFLALWLPGAYVVLDTEQLQALTPWRILRVVCAGVWLNGLLCLACWMLGLLLPALLLPLYSTGQGAVIWSVPQQSPIAGHLHPGDMITAVNGCRVRGAEAFKQCVYRQDAYQLVLPPLAPVPGSNMAPDGSPSEDRQAQLAGSHQGYCVPAASGQLAHGCSLNMRQERGTQCGSNELCFLDVHFDFAAAGLQGALELLTADADVERHVLHGQQANDTKGTGVCLRARHVAMYVSCSSSDADACPEGSQCLAPLLHLGAHMLKLAYRPASRTAAGPPMHRTYARRQLQQAGASARRRRRHWSAKRHRCRHCRDLVRRAAGQPYDSFGDLKGQLRSWVADHHVGEPDIVPASAEANGDGAVGANSSSSSGTSARDRTGLAVDQVDGPAGSRDAGPEHPYVVWVATSAEALAAFELTSFLPRMWLVPLWLPPVIQMQLSYIFAVSAAVALLNMLPVAYLDGAAALNAALETKHSLGPLSTSGCAPSLRSGIRLWLPRMCTGLLCFVAVTHVLRLLY